MQGDYGAKSCVKFWAICWSIFWANRNLRELFKIRVLKIFRTLNPVRAYSLFSILYTNPFLTHLALSVLLDHHQNELKKRSTYGIGTKCDPIHSVRI